MHHWVLGRQNIFSNQSSVFIAVKHEQKPRTQHAPPPTTPPPWHPTVECFNVQLSLVHVKKIHIFDQEYVIQMDVINVDGYWGHDQRYNHLCWHIKICLVMNKCLHCSMFRNWCQQCNYKHGWTRIYDAECSALVSQQTYQVLINKQKFHCFDCPIELDVSVVNCPFRFISPNNC